MSSYTKSVIAALAALAAITVLLASMASGAPTPQNRALRKCFPAAKWGPAQEKFRPCVFIGRVYEDGSFSFVVTDADGTVRYSSGVGALDR